MNSIPTAYASRAERLFANLIDSMILILPAVLSLAILGQNDAAFVAVFACNMAYFTGFHSSNWQATPGKRLMNIHVVRLDGRPLTQRDGLERFLAYVLPSLPAHVSFLSENTALIVSVWLSIFWFAPILFNPERAAIHDQICKTRVMVGRVG